jgi:ankyrin repeat protein
VGTTQQAPLHSACASSQLEIVKMLLKAGALINTLCAGKSALRVAIENGSWECAGVLLEASADISSKDGAGSHFSFCSLFSLVVVFLDRFACSSSQAILSCMW